MKKIHFFKAKSRLGLPNVPHRQKKLNIGVEKGPDGILTKNFLGTIDNYNYRVSDFLFSNPEDIDKKFFNNVLADNYYSFKEFIINNLSKNETQVVIGGDDSITFSSILSTIDRFGNNFGYIRIDSHPDLHLHKTSPTKNFHGMYHRALFDSFDIPQISKLVEHKMKPGNTIFIGNLDINPGEKEFFEEKKFRNINSEDFLKDRKNINKFINEFVKSFNHIHISFDIDALDKTVAPATGIPAEKGLLMNDILPILNIISKHPSISFDLTEVNPEKKGAKKTIKTAHEILKAIISG